MWKFGDSTTSVERIFSPARRAAVIKVPLQDDEYKSGDAVQDKATQCIDVAGENAMTAMEFTTGSCSPCLYQSSVSENSVFRHGDDFVVPGTRPQQKDFEEQMSEHLIFKHFARTVHSILETPKRSGS